MKDSHSLKHRKSHEEHTRKKCRRKRDMSRDRSRSRSVEKTDRSRDTGHHSKRKEHHGSRRGNDYTAEGRKDRRERMKEESFSYDDPQRRNRGKRKDLPPVPKSKWENDENDSKDWDHAGNSSQPKWGKKDDPNDKKPIENKAKPDFGLSGKLAEEVNTYKGVVIKYSEPAEARMPKRRWRLYPFKGDEAMPTLYIHRQSGYLIGRDRVVVDIPIDHPSCSKQHAVLQYRVVPYTRENGTKGNRIRPYIIDLESANGTYVNNQKIEAKKYVELLEKDVIKFAYSSREYVLLHEHSKHSDEDDDVLVSDK